MSTTIKIGIVVIILAIITYFLVGYVYGKATIADVMPKPLDLSKENRVYDSDSVRDTLLTQGGSSICLFINYRLGDRTTSMDNDYITMFGIKGVLNFNVSPTQTQIVIATRGDKKDTETIDLPKLPQQKWVFISILRDGRRFDVMYDDRIVASHRLKLFPMIMQNPLIVGNKKLIGSAVHCLVAGYRLSPNEVAKERAKLSDMDGKPPVSEPESSSIPFLSWKNLEVKCIPGLPCNPLSKPPPNALKAWSSPYN